MSRTYPKISIITPSYGQAQYMEQTIQSVVSQNYPNLEFIIIDGCSTDGTTDIIKKYGKHLKYWVSEPDNGQAHAINKGLKHATGNLVNWLNSDDYLEPGALYALAEAWQRYPDSDVFCGFTRCFWDETNKTSHTYRMGLRCNATSTLLNIQMNQPGTFYKTSVMKELGGVNESLRYVFDDELWMRYLCSYGQSKVVKLKTLIANFRQHGNSKSYGEGFTGFYDEQQQILLHLANIISLRNSLLTCLKEEPIGSNYQPGTWDLKQLNTDQFGGWFENKYMVTLWNQGFKKDAKQGLKKSLRYGYFNFDRKSISLLFWK